VRASASSQLCGLPAQYNLVGSPMSEMSPFHR
jgi:hypothetical protein